MKAAAAFLLILSYLSISHGWTCREGPQLPSVTQIDAGQGNVVARDKYSRAFFLSGSSWYRLGTVALKHVSVGTAGIWGVDHANKVYKYIAGKFIPSNGLTLQQVDAGGRGQVVGIGTSSKVHCLKSSLASAFKQTSTLSWNTLTSRMAYFSCGPLDLCWAVNQGHRIHFLRIRPSSCGVNSWVYVPGAAKMVEVGTNGSVFIVTTAGQVYERAGITSKVPQGTHWVHIPMCLTVNHVSYGLGRLWVASTSGVILQCFQ